ncbi:PRC-barrel domain-containing protein [Phormidium tenue FACHB-886]|nr:PRC-barrel domain-containing protein [Phormidium tenue FACHB-886]
MNLPEQIKQSELLNRLVLDRRTLEELGRVETLWMHPPVQRVLGFICKAGLLGNQKSAFRLEQISALGESGVLTQGSPEPTTAERVRQLESLISYEIWGEGGDRVGKITDCLFNLQTGAITHYLYISSGWAGVVGEVYQLPTSAILSMGSRRVLVLDDAAANFPLYQEGVPQKLTKAKTALTQEAAQEWQSLTHRATDFAEHAKERLQNLTEQAKERTQQLSQQAKETAQTLNEQLQVESRSFSERARETSQQIAGQVKARSRAISRQVEDGIETLTFQAEEILDSVREKPADSFTSSAQRNPDQHKPEQPGSAVSPDASAPEEDDDEPWI